ncbi:alpha-amylase family glycosyl hydrolase [Sporofaciens musculi]|uniref:alpha-amylase family glycosyl hydrolase n=1 Tax=Sporofaciens musculi TaxID=2681861 RepID=UPI0025700BFD|nr:alpha-amylase family glycosyl hydrolase [Sporofaciens musculi]
MAKKSRKERKQAAAKQNTGKQNIVEQNVAVQAAEVKTKVESEDMEAVKVETQEEEAVKTTEAVSESAVEEVKVYEDAAEAKSTSEAVKAEDNEAKAKSTSEAVKAEDNEAEAKSTSEEVKTEDNEAFRKAEQRAVYEKRFARHFDELKWLYMELYGNSSMFAELCDNLYRFYEERNKDLKEIDQNREACPDWYKQNDMLGMMFYIDNFAGNMKGVESKLDYVEKSNVNYIHLMPFLDTVEGRSDGGYAVADFRKVQEKLGTMEDLESLTAACHKKDINVCMDFVMNHTSEDHEWAKKARQGIGEYMSRYFFFDNYSIPAQYEKTVPQVFPTTAPGNFTWLPEVEHFVMTSFYPYQWDLNYKNPRVFNEMMYNFLFLANKGIDIIRIDAVPYIWKELNTQCRNLPQVHTIVRMMRMIGEIVCPSVLLLGEVVMEPEKVVPYFGTVEKPECHMLYNVTTMATTWHTVATRDVGLLRQQLDIVNRLPKEYVFLNYLRCHDDIGWGLDYASLLREGIRERPHKQYLNDYFQGYVGESTSRGELYNADPITGDARFCGTTASMCGIEKAGFEQDAEAMERAIQKDIMLHAYMFMQSGIPVLYSGDEIGQVNDYTYKEDPHKAADSRYIHRGAMRWDLAENITDADTVEGKVFQRLGQLEKIRKSEKVFVSTADTWTIETWEAGVLSIGRYFEGEKLIGIFNFSEYDKTAWINEEDGMYVDLISGEKMEARGVNIPAFGFYYLKKEAEAE